MTSLAKNSRYCLPNLFILCRGTGRGVELVHELVADRCDFDQQTLLVAVDHVHLAKLTRLRVEVFCKGSGSLLATALSTEAKSLRNAVNLAERKVVLRIDVYTDPIRGRSGGRPEQAC